ncbi:hypothetical protein ACFPRA_00940 [Sporosarcina soli]|uniref:ABC-2 family transporter protein n=1 Tax=Sporosarcina soli TaxID=334736 RepID=A0ABW0TFU1_9BACL
MRVLWNEIRKIFTWKTLLLLVLVNVVLYFIRIEFYITSFLGGDSVYSYNIAVEMVELYGTHMDEDEFLDFKKIFDEQVKEADLYLQARKEFRDLGIETYEQFRSYNPFNNPNEDLNALHSKVMFEEEVELFWELQERARLIDFHEVKENIPSNVNDKQQRRYEELFADKQYEVYSGIALDNFKEFITNVAIAILFSVVLVISPMILKDRSRQIVALQYTSKKGRNLHKTKILAGIISTFMVITALLVVYFSLYATNNTSMFFEVPINAFIAMGNPTWYNLTFFQYILLCVVAIYVIGFVYGLLAMFFSSIVPNTMTLIGIQIPFVIGLIIFGMNPLLRFIISIGYSQWLAPTIYSGMIVVSAIFIILLWRREKNRDIV